MSGRYIERVILGSERGALSLVIRGLLWPLSLVYRIGLACYLALYRLGLRKRTRLPATVVSIGNLTFGGTGKTPAVQAVCEMLLGRGVKIAVLSRGHGGRAKGCAVVSDGSSIFMDSNEAGDEPVMLARSLHGVPVIVGKDRRESGRMACRMFDPDIIVLDDGMQYWQLHRDVEISVLDAARPFGSGLVMPAGDLREPVGGLRRADIVLLNNSAGLPDLELRALETRLSHLAPNAELVRCRRVPVGFVSAKGAEFALSWAEGRSVAAFCGIGQPRPFFDGLRSLGAIITREIEFPDHYLYSDSDIAALDEACRDAGADALVTTEKDLARLRPDAFNAEVFAHRVKLEIEDITRLADKIDSAHKAFAATQTAD